MTDWNDVLAPSRGTSALLQDRRFGVFLGGKLASSCGVWTHNVTAAVAVYNLTGSAFMTGLVSVQLGIPRLLLAPVFGVLADRFDRHWLIILGRGCSALSLALLAAWIGALGLQGLPGVWPLFVGAFLTGLGASFSAPAMQAIVPALVPKEDLDQAIALASITPNIARAVGPALAAGLLFVGGVELAYAVSALALATLALAVWTIRLPRIERPVKHDSGVRRGFVYILADKLLVRRLLAIAALGFAVDSVLTLAPPLADSFGGGGTAVGLFVSLYGIGAMLTVPGIARLRQRFGMRRLAAVGGGMMATSLFSVAISPGATLAAVAFLFTGSGVLLASTTLTAGVQHNVEEAFRGRVMATWGMAYHGIRPLAAGINGALADFASVEIALLMCSLVATLACLLILRIADEENELL